MKGSYIKIWIPVGAKVENDANDNDNDGQSESADYGYVNHTYNATENDLVSLGFVPIEERVDLLLKQNGISYINKAVGLSQNSDTLKKSEENNILIQIFVPELILEDILIGLQKCGVGVVTGTGLSLIPTVVNYFGEDGDVPDYSSPQTSTQHSISTNAKEYRIDKFYKSIKSRLIVAEVIKRIEGGSEFSFDYVCLLIVAACLAFMGLVENSSVILVASMLVSPIMGPILAIVFGTCIKNKKLVKIGIYRELYSLAICILCGFIFGCIFVVKFNRTRNLLAITSDNWPTTEMASRTGWSCLVVGLAIAIPSGVGVAISVLGGNAGSMVGVAISASLLPPAVNTGLYWAMSMISYGFDDTSRFNKDQIYDNITVGGETFVFEYASYGDIPQELFFRGVISFILTMVNIIGIVLVGVLILLLKQVTPASIPQRNAAFWKKDIVLNREYEKSLQETNIGNIADVIAGESIELGLSGTFLEALFEEAVKDKEVIDSRKWVDKNYPRDDLNKMSGQSTSLTSSPVLNSKFFDSNGRFKILPALRSLRKPNHQITKSKSYRDVSLIIEEEVKNAIEMQAKSRGVERRGSFQNPEVKNAFDLIAPTPKSSTLPRM
eukprot:GFUD01120915.1.p1 GENE.GFUD01120915.1~~GFUD01120915.1.p1  ORF type:complete len:609 (+),score=97.80 GFUD01120915.1:35-1861(+)